jgi:hypothetical protein
LKILAQGDMEQIPVGIFDLKQLKILILDGKKIQLDLPIHELQDLEEIEVIHSSLVGAEGFAQAKKRFSGIRI